VRPEFDSLVGTSQKTFKNLIQIMGGGGDQMVELLAQFTSHLDEKLSWWKHVEYLDEKLSMASLSSKKQRIM